MKNKLSIILVALFHMIAGLGLVSLLNFSLIGYPNLPILFVVLGLSFGLLIWWRKTIVVEEMTAPINIKYLKFYVYLFQLFLYVFAYFGCLELFCQYSGQSSIEEYKSYIFSWNSYTFSWKSVVYPIMLIYLWQAKAENIYRILTKRMQEV